MSIKRLFLQELVSFREIELEFDPGLVVLTGPSGAGKSLLIQSVLSNFGLANSEAALCEVTLEKPKQVISEAFELGDELVIKSIKKDRMRHYLEGQNISKKSLTQIFANSVNYLSVRDKGGFESATLLMMIDSALKMGDTSFKKLLKEYKKRYQNYTQKLSELEKIQEDEKKLLQLIEFTTYEIEKIKSINPKVDEDKELIRIKQQLSKIDKINDAVERANLIFTQEEVVSEVFRLLDKDISYFTDAMNQLRSDFDEAQNLAEELSDINVEEVLDRLEQLSGLKKRYGSIGEALEYLQLKEKELSGYQSIEQDKSLLESFLAIEYAELMILAQRISQARRSQALELEKSLGGSLSELKLPRAKFLFTQESLGNFGIDRIDIVLGRTEVAMLSGGEFNRLRLALMVASIEGKGDDRGIVVLDEIDANVSGDESIAIAAMVSKLSEAYQVFAISHQPHLSAKANQHILVTKSSGVSSAKILDAKERIIEISRIIGGENSNDEALAFARKLRDHHEN